MRFWTIIGLITVLSAVGLTYEIAAGRVLAPFFGTSLVTWTAVIATVLAGFSVGSAWGGFVAEADRGEALAQVRVALVGAAVLAATSPTLLGLIYGWGARGTDGMLVAVVVTFFPFSVLITLPSPLLAKLAVEARPGREGSSLGLVLAAGSTGAIAGAVLAGFVTLPLIGSAATFAACGAVALVCVLFLWDRSASLLSVAVAGGLVGVSALGGAACRYESGLSCIDVSRTGARVELFADGTKQAGERTDGEGLLALPYTEWLWARMERDLGDAPYVLFVGGGGYTLPTKLLETRDDARAVAVEIDPLVTRVVKEHLPQAGAMIGQAGDGRLEIVHADGRVYLNDTEQRFDAAVMDAFSSGSVPAHLATREAYARLAEIVAGPVYVNLIDVPDGRLARGVHAILDALYPHVIAVRGPGSGRTLVNILLAASREPLTPLDILPNGYGPAEVSEARAFTDDRGWVGHR